MMEKMLSGCRLANAEALPGFSGGFVGYFSYENVEYFEDIRLEKHKGPKIPDGIFFLCRDLVIFDHYRKTLVIVSLVETSPRGRLQARYREAEKKMAGLAARLRRPLVVPAKSAKKTTPPFEPNMTPAAFQKKVRRIKEYIRAGDCIQVVLSQRFRTHAPSEDFQIYRALRSINPSPYMFYFRSGKVRLIGSSPEMLVKKTGRTAEVRPIAGTRPRGKSPAEDLALEESLKKSSKELAEHLMLVDLGRNDLGRVCQFRTIRVEDYARVERYSHVMHLVSDVVGKLKPGKNAFDLLKAAFPAGTVTGAPKIRAMQIISELEAENRGPYAGCLGYFSFNQDMD
ncbi:MAG: anthranilate synthase component I family protein, partial [candidate division Zixibacteria bacterium]|nr:anthranilate synthase component I family protein [candidate division Zixibacteria bacterium]